MSTEPMSMAEANKKYFNSERANGYNVEPWMRKISDTTAAFLRANLDFIGAHWVAPGENGVRPVRLLDYACGPGMISRALGPYVTECKGVDISEAMVSRYNEESTAGRLAPIPCHAVEGNLLVPESELDASLKSADLYGFDIAAVGYGFHHFQNPAESIVQLAQRLRPGGVLLIIDFSTDHGPIEAGPAKGAIHTHGFSEGTMKKVFEDAGLRAAGYSVMPETLELRMRAEPVYRKAFVGRAQKPA